MQDHHAARAALQGTKTLELVEVAQVAVQVPRHDKLPGGAESQQRGPAIGIFVVQPGRLQQPLARLFGVAGS